jgi:hypothetical protein
MSQQHQDLLTKYEIPFEIKNDGTHLIVEGNINFIDYWPSTGKWIDRNQTRSGFGVRTLIHYITVDSM